MDDGCRDDRAKVQRQEFTGFGSGSGSGGAGWIGILLFIGVPMLLALLVTRMAELRVRAMWAEEQSRLQSWGGLGPYGQLPPGAPRPDSTTTQDQP